MSTGEIGMQVERKCDRMACFDLIDVQTLLKPSGASAKPALSNYLVAHV